MFLAHLRHADVSFTCYTINRITCLTSLADKEYKIFDFKGVRICDIGIHTLRKLQCVRQLKTLILDYNGITSNGAVELFSILSKNPVIEHLSVRGNSIDDSIALSLQQFVSSTTSLKTLDLSGVYFILLFIFFFLSFFLKNIFSIFYFFNFIFILFIYLLHFK